jgi:superfamily I DNA and/or RNA helicase
LGNCLPSESGRVARAVIDEAGQCHPAHAVCALMRSGSALVIGDTQQLEPVIEVSREEEARLFQSCGLRTPPAQLAPYRLHDRALQSTQGLAERAVPVTERLVDHFRCQREIIEISNALCGYGLVVHTASATRSAVAPLLAAPVAWLDLKGEQTQLGGSWCNELELQATLSVLLRLLESGIAPAEIAVITPYRGQLERLRRALSERRVPIEYSPEVAEVGAENLRPREGLALGTVHRFQGGERSVVLFSSVITRAQSLGFLNARPNLLNVAVSRARHHFIGIGDRSLMARGRLTRLVTEHAQVLQVPARRHGGEI